MLDGSATVEEWLRGCNAAVEPDSPSELASLLVVVGGVLPIGPPLLREGGAAKAAAFGSKTAGKLGDTTVSGLTPTAVMEDSTGGAGATGLTLATGFRRSSAVSGAPPGASPLVRAAGRGAGIGTGRASAPGGAAYTEDGSLPGGNTTNTLLPATGADSVACALRAVEGACRSRSLRTRSASK